MAISFVTRTMPKLIHSITLPNGDSFTVGRPWTQRYARSGVDVERSTPRTRADIPSYMKEASKGEQLKPEFEHHTFKMSSELIDTVVLAIFHWPQEAEAGADEYKEEHYEIFGIPYENFLGEKYRQNPETHQMESYICQRLIPKWWLTKLDSTTGVSITERKHLGPVAGAAPDAPPQLVEVYKRFPGSGVGYFEASGLGVQCEIPIRGQGNERVEYAVPLADMYAEIHGYMLLLAAAEAGDDGDDEDGGEEEGETPEETTQPSARSEVLAPPTASHPQMAAPITVQPQAPRPMDAAQLAALGIGADIGVARPGGST